MPRTSSKTFARGRFTGLVIGIVALAGCASEPAATPRPLITRPSPAPSPSPVRYSDVRPEDLIPPAPGDYRVQPGDVLEVTIGDLIAPGVETTKRCRVSGSGTISLPLVPPIPVAGLTEAQINERVNRIMHDID
jgi:protein involved in polysaccharide export with SLBB domain